MSVSTIVVSMDPVATAEMVTGVDPGMEEERYSVSKEFCAKRLPVVSVRISAIRALLNLLDMVEREG